MQKRTKNIIYERLKSCRKDRKYYIREVTNNAERTKTILYERFKITQKGPESTRAPRAQLSAGFLSRGNRNSEEVKVEISRAFCMK